MCQTPEIQVSVVCAYGDADAQEFFEMYEQFARCIFPSDEITTKFPSVDIPNGSRAIFFDAKNPRAATNVAYSDIVHTDSPQYTDVVEHSSNASYIFYEMDGLVPQNVWRETENRIFLPWYLDDSHRISFKSDEDRWEYEDKFDEIFKKLGFSFKIPTPGVPYHIYPTHAEDWVGNWGYDNLTDYSITTENIR